ncbi:hypothetical protein OF83DRAFT_1174369 [Amylostereum chailletii]|nr:hypothetical protein OF83DRAFT_1174369 [Amylostereum chailletii]
MFSPWGIASVLAGNTPSQRAVPDDVMSEPLKSGARNPTITISSDKHWLEYLEYWYRDGPPPHLPATLQKPSRSDMSNTVTISTQRKTVSASPPCQPSPSLRYDADDEGVFKPPLGESSNHNRDILPGDIVRKSASGNARVMAMHRTDFTQLKDRFRPQNLANANATSTATASSDKPRTVMLTPSTARVTDEARRLLETQLAEARVQLERNTSYIRSLEAGKAKLAKDLEELSRAARKERAQDVESENKEKKAAEAEARARRAEETLEREKRRREVAEIEARKVRAEMRDMGRKVEDLERKLEAAVREKREMEESLAKLASGDGNL